MWCEILFRSSGEMLFVNALDVSEGGEDAASSPDEPVHYWARVRAEEGKLTFRLPRFEPFRQAVQDGRLPGRVDAEDNVILDRLLPEHLALIDSPEANLLDWVNPLVFVRVGD